MFSKMVKLHAMTSKKWSIYCHQLRFSAKPWKREDIQGSFVVLGHAELKSRASPSEISREWAVKSLSPRQWASVGEVHSARVDAMDMLDTALGQKPTPCTIRYGHELGISREEMSKHLAERYGT